MRAAQDFGVSEAEAPGWQGWGSERGFRRPAAGLAESGSGTNQERWESSDVGGETDRTCVQKGKRGERTCANLGV